MECQTDKSGLTWMTQFDMCELSHARCCLPIPGNGTGTAADVGASPQGSLPQSFHQSGGLAQCFRECRTGGCIEISADVFVVWIRGQMPRGGIARVVIPKDEAAICSHILVAIFESDDAGTELKKFLEVEYRPIGKRR